MKRYLKEIDLPFLLGTLVGVILLLLILLATLKGITRYDDVQHTLTTEGYSAITLYEAPGSFTCRTMYVIRFAALDSAQQKVEGSVCVGLVSQPSIVSQ